MRSHCPLPPTVAAEARAATVEGDESTANGAALAATAIQATRDRGAKGNDVQHGAAFGQIRSRSPSLKHARWHVGACATATTCSRTATVHSSGESSVEARNSAPSRWPSRRPSCSRLAAGTRSAANAREQVPLDTAPRPRLDSSLPTRRKLITGGKERRWFVADL
jgi:hypothetical protein